MKRSEVVAMMVKEWRIYLDNPENCGIRNGMDHVLSRLEKELRLSHPVPFGVWAHLDKDDPEYDIRTIYITDWDEE